MSIHAPYNFVPLSRFIYLPHWAEQVSHDVPFSDGVSGTLTVELTCHTSTLVGGKRIKTPDGKPDIVEFCKDPNDNPIIPGSSTKGLLSNVLEIASFARFNRLDDKRYSVRDLRADFYMNQFKGGAVNTGWLTFNADKWEITPCDMVRIHQDKIINHFNIDKTSWVDKEKNKKAYQRYQLLNGIKTLKFDKEVREITLKDNKKIKMDIAEPSDTGSEDGLLVVTGQPGDPYNSGSMDKYDSNKKWEFVFYNPNKGKPKEVDKDVMQSFKFIHSESDDWTFWEKHPDLTKDTGIPVFYLEKAGNITSIGLSSLYRLAYKKTTHDAVKHTHSSHIHGHELDLPELIFGRIGENEEMSLKGRVNIGTAKLIPGTADDYNNCKEECTVLSTPKPTFSPAYIRQPNSGNNGNLRQSNSYATFMDESELSGWKRYPSRSTTNILPPTSLHGEPENTKVQVKLKPITAGARFKLKIHIHNLREVELGALLWSIDFGNRADHYHGLGMGKPYALGRISLKIINEESQLIPLGQSEFKHTDLLDKAKTSFTKLMEDAYRFTEQDHKWIDSPQLKELLAMASQPPAKGALSYMKTPQEFVDAKKAKQTLLLHSGARLKASDISKEVAKVSENELLNDEDFLPYLEQLEAERAEAEKQAKWEQEASPLDLFIKDLQDKVNVFLKDSSKNSPKLIHSLLQKFKKDNLDKDISVPQIHACLSIADLLVPLLEEKKIDKKILNRFINPLRNKIGDQGE